MRASGTRWESKADLLRLYALLLFALASNACAGGTKAGGPSGGPDGGATSGAGGGSGSPGTGGGGSPGTGIRVPDIPIDGAGGASMGLGIRESTLGTDADGQVLWLFTFQNQNAEPACRTQFTAKLFDAQGAMLAGSEGLVIYLQGVPAFTGEVTGSMYFVGEYLLNCVPPGGRGVGHGHVYGQENFTLSSDEVSRLLEAGARIEYTFSPGPSSTTGITAADDLLRLEGLSLADIASGKVVQGTARSGVALSSWRADVALFDTTGQLVDLVSTRGTAMAADAEVAFETTPGKASATGFEAFPQATILR